ncbi:MAG: DUF2442 domain-containing protein [Planctomycetes bacterium]|nr:DUF2442 domain-containing protein [Planctomycetota bacterium]
MKLSKPGKNTLNIEVTNISGHGFWLLLEGKEYFLPFEHFPWFKSATIQQICEVQFLHKTHLYWPSLDIDLSLNIISQPEKYKLIAK